MNPGTFGTDCQSHCSPGAGPRVQAISVTEGQFCVLDEACRCCCTMVSQPVPVIPWESLRPPWLTLTSQLNQGIMTPSLLKWAKMPVLWGHVDKGEKAAYRKTLPTFWFLTSVSNPVIVWAFLSLGCIWPSSIAELRDLGAIPWLHKFLSQKWEDGRSGDSFYQGEYHTCLVTPACGQKPHI